MSVHHLIKIAKGGVDWKGGSWFGIPIPQYYSLTSQLNAIRALGESRSREALDFLWLLADSKFDIETDWADRRLVRRTFTRTWHPSAKGSLFKVLETAEMREDHDDINHHRKTEKKHRRYAEAKAAIDQAVKHLLRELGSGGSEGASR